MDVAPDPVQQQAWQSLVQELQSRLEATWQTLSYVEKEITSGNAGTSMNRFLDIRDGLRENVTQQMNNFKTLTQGGAQNLRDFMVNTLKWGAKETGQFIQQGGFRAWTPTVTRVVTSAPAMSPGAATVGGVVPEIVPALEGIVPQIEANLPVVAAQVEQNLPAAVATGAGTSAAGAAAGFSLGTILAFGAAGVALVLGGLFIYNKVTQPSPPSSAPAVTAPQESGSSAPSDTGAPANPLSFDIDGTYNGKVGGTSCVAPDCYVALTKSSDPSGPGTDQAGSIRVLFVVNIPLALNGVASQQHFSDGPMDASLLQDGSVQGSGTTTSTDTSQPGAPASSQVSYTLSGTIHNGQSGSPWYDLQLTVDTIPYALTGAR